MEEDNNGKLELKEQIYEEGFSDDSGFTATESAVVSAEDGSVNSTALAPLKKGKNKKEKITDVSAFFDIANLTGRSAEDVVDECLLFETQKIMRRLGKVIVRYNVSDAELEKILYNAEKLNMGEVSVSPAYIPSCKRRVRKLSLEKQKISAFIDFPFGESSYKSKMTDVKDAIKTGVDGIMVMLPTMLLAEENVKLFRAQTKKLGRLCGVEKGVALAATDLNDEQIKRAVKLVERTNLDFICFVFGEASENEIKRKLKLINKHKGEKSVKIVGNITNAESAMEVLKTGADVALTPYADEIGLDLIKRFKVKNVKLR